MYFEEREATRNRRNIGFEAKNGSQKRKIRMDDFRKKQRADPTLERAARHNTLQVDVEEVKRETVSPKVGFLLPAAARLVNNCCENYTHSSSSLRVTAIRLNRF